MTTTTPETVDSAGKRFWWQHLTAYHWFVFIVASAAWFFDCLDQRIFSLARIPALASLMHQAKGAVDVQSNGKIVTACFLIGWGIGGLTFGSLGDKFGRSRMLAVSILTYASFTSLCFFAATWQQFAAFRFLTGLGIGGVFGLAVALIAETVPTIARPHALGLLQVLSTFGNLTSALVNFEIGTHFPPDRAWRWMFLAGAAPALLVIVATRFVREPERWLELKRAGLLPKGGPFAPYRQLFGDPRWRRNVVVGALIASTGVVGLWAIGEYATDLQANIFGRYYRAQGVADVNAQVERARTIAFVLNQLGAGLGMWLFTKIAATAGRRPAFLLGFSSALVVTVLVYWKMNTPTDAYWMMTLMGVAQLSVFAGFSIYLPELFGSSVRSTGTSFCYNLGRFAAAGGSFFSFILSAHVFARFAHGDRTSPLPLRYSAMTMCAIFLIGLATLPFAPETKGQPLPE
ncbi:MAG TPA: MFS transporter [Tepidisphaeraceae bacterium]|jgi:MFS family permease